MEASQHSSTYSGPHNVTSPDSHFITTVRGTFCDCGQYLGSFLSKPEADESHTAHIRSEEIWAWVERFLNTRSVQA